VVHYEMARDTKTALDRGEKAIRMEGGADQRESPNFSIISITGPREEIKPLPSAGTQPKKKEIVNLEKLQSKWWDHLTFVRGETLRKRGLKVYEVQRRSSV